jgi:hypothetical protein
MSVAIPHLAWRVGRTGKAHLVAVCEVKIGGIHLRGGQGVCSAQRNIAGTLIAMPFTDGQRCQGCIRIHDEIVEGTRLVLTRRSDNSWRMHTLTPQEAPHG